MTRTHTSRTPTIGTRAVTASGRRSRVVLGLLIAAVSIVGVVRTFDPVRVSVAQVVFLLTTVVGVALAQLHVE